MLHVIIVPYFRVLWEATQGPPVLLEMGRARCPQAGARPAAPWAGGCRGKEALSSFRQTSWPQKAKHQGLSIVSAVIWRKKIALCVIAISLRAYGSP